MTSGGLSFRFRAHAVRRSATEDARDSVAKISSRSRK